MMGSGKRLQASMTGRDLWRDIMLIRKEEPKDYEIVYSIVKNAFDSAEHSDGNEQDLVNALRKGESFIPELSLVTEINGKIVGHIMFTRATVGRDAVLVLAPLSVVPKYQRKGITFGIKPPFDVPDENFMAYKIKEGAPDIHGIVKYAKEFGID